MEQSDKGAILKTKNGSRISRSKYGVGKDIGGAIYLHREYINDLPKEWQDVINSNEPKDFNWNVIKYDYKSKVPTYFNSEDFDIDDEPVAGEYIVIKDGKQKKGKTDSIWHHKWLFVGDDYKRFDVSESIERSRKWLALDGVESTKIGSKKYWDEKVLPRIEEGYSWVEYLNEELLPSRIKFFFKVVKDKIQEISVTIGGKLFTRDEPFSTFKKYIYHLMGTYAHNDGATPLFVCSHKGKFVFSQPHFFQRYDERGANTHDPRHPKVPEPTMVEFMDASFDEYDKRHLTGKSMMFKRIPEQSGSDTKLFGMVVESAIGKLQEKRLEKDDLYLTTYLGGGMKTDDVVVNVKMGLGKPVTIGELMAAVSSGLLTEQAAMERILVEVDGVSEQYNVIIL